MMGLSVVSKRNPYRFSCQVTSRRDVQNNMLDDRQVPASRVLRTRLSAMAFGDCEGNLPEPNPEVGKGFPQANAPLQACRLKFRSIMNRRQF